jgi:hypothetical protein
VTRPIARAGAWLLPFLAAGGCSVSEPAPLENGAAGPAAEPRSLIPAALHGTWALEPGDCAGGVDAASRLLIISADELRQSGWRARPSGNVLEATAATLNAEFAFEGRGESWRQQQAFRLWGDKLVRRDGSQAETTLYFPCR